MLEKLVKKEYTKIIFSLYGILSLLSLILPFVMIGFGIWFMVGHVNDYGIIWIVVGVVFILFSIRKVKDFFPVFKYAFNPKKFPIIKALEADGIDLSLYDKEIEEAKIPELLNKNNPLITTENFVFGFSQVNFFALRKEDLLWVYEYNGNGLVFYDKHKIYGFTFYPTVDGNDFAIEALENEMPYLYYGIDFDYQTIMHTDFDNTVIYIEEEKKRFLANPEGYKEEKAAIKKAKEEEETRKFEEERGRQVSEILEKYHDDDDEDNPQEQIETEEQPQEEPVQEENKEE